MRIALVSPPPMHPTSPPLGPAALSAFLMSRDPELEVRCFDLNLHFYRKIVQLIDEEKFSIRLYDWSEQKSRARLLTAISLISNQDWPNRQLKQYHSAASIFLSFENIFNGFMTDMGRRLCLGLPVPARLELFFQELLQPVIDYHPDLFGLSVQFSQQLEFSALFLKLCKEQLNIPTVLGGAWSGVVPHPEDLFMSPMLFTVENKNHPFQLKEYLDYLIPGEGENGLLDICTMLKGGMKSAQVANLIYRKGGQIRKNPPSVIMDLSTLPIPDFSSFNLPDYFLPRPVLPLQLSRGCPWQRCTFCTHHHSYLNYRQVPVKTCIDILSSLKQDSQCDCFSFVDEMILPKRFLALADEIVARKLDITYGAYAKPSDKFSQKLLERLQCSGCRVMMWGLESANQRVLDLMDKGTRVEIVKKVIERAAGSGIMNLLFVLFGFPTETEEELLNTVTFLKENSSRIHALAMGTFVLTEGSQVHRQPEKFSIVIRDKSKDPANRTLKYDTERGMSASRVDTLFKQQLPELNQIGPSRRLAGYRDHLLLWATANSCGRKNVNFKKEFIG
ncbi:MAG: B12-binding domain-containing radical SAM protein [Thermodesulfobacteriota bacterium]